MSDHEDVDALFEDDPGPLEEVIDEDDAEDLKLDQAENKVWLVKVPRFLSEMWKKIDQENVRLGSVRIYKDSAQQGKSSVSLVLPDNETTATIPKEYSINFISTDVQNKFVFSQSDHGKAISGTVYHEGVAVPTETNAYRNIMRKRVMEAGTPQRTTQVLGQNNQPIFVPGASSTVPTSDFADFVQSKKPRLDKEKATRMPRNELMDLLFAAFDRYPYWSFKGILEETKQPSQYLKEILNEICILNKRGPYAGNYQLKPEFKQRLSAAEKQNAVEKSPEEATSSEDEEFMEDVKL
ncbi:hypothetical protein RMATCC62417_12581 [Rhizopus microsporus]|nr:hypothetical protein RMATCC62417_12581 [Rhizopus microsporus]CEJ01894.1 hypothetical protein RMCBS344292_15915 [Rhizopus microsporus]